MTKLAAFKWKKKAVSDDDVRAVVFLAHGYAGMLFSAVVRCNSSNVIFHKKVLQKAVHKMYRVPIVVSDYILLTQCYPPALQFLPDLQLPKQKRADNGTAKS